MVAQQVVEAVQADLGLDGLGWASTSLSLLLPRIAPQQGMPRPPALCMVGGGILLRRALGGFYRLRPILRVRYFFQQTPRLERHYGNITKVDKICDGSATGSSGVSSSSIQIVIDKLEDVIKYWVQRYLQVSKLTI
jgi:hypothetical protein